MDRSNRWMWCFVAGVLEWDERIYFKDDSLMDVYQLWIPDVNNAFVWFADKYCVAQTFPHS